MALPRFVFLLVFLTVPCGTAFTQELLLELPLERHTRRMVADTSIPLDDQEADISFFVNSFLLPAGPGEIRPDFFEPPTFSLRAGVGEPGVTFSLMEGDADFGMVAGWLTDPEAPFVRISASQPGSGANHSLIKPLTPFDPAHSVVSRIEWELDADPFTTLVDAELGTSIDYQINSVLRIYGTVVPEPNSFLMVLPVCLLFVAARKSRVAAVLRQ